MGACTFKPRAAPSSEALRSLGAIAAARPHSRRPHCVTFPTCAFRFPLLVFFRPLAKVIGNPGILSFSPPPPHPPQLLVPLQNVAWTASCQNSLRHRGSAVVVSDASGLFRKDRSDIFPDRLHNRCEISSAKAFENPPVRLFYVQERTACQLSKSFLIRFFFY